VRVMANERNSLTLHMFTRRSVGVVCGPRCFRLVQMSWVCADSCAMSFEQRVWRWDCRPCGGWLWRAC